ncbi:MAG TPA: hypothetical protein VHC20_05530 [Candidatus Paceibacterota bacterium]|nr:hypothetical protein [Candidatus Paceibacterota bacterium]
MKRLIEILIPLFCLLQASGAEEFKPIKEFSLDEHMVFTIPVSGDRVTTISFPGPIAAIDAAQVTVDGKTPANFQIAHTKASHFFSVRALGKKAVTNVNVRWNDKTYVLELVESDEPLYSVIFNVADEPRMPQRIAVTPNRLLALLDKAKAYPLLKEHHPEAVAQVEYLNYVQKPRVMDYKAYEVQIEEVFRFDPEDTLVFRVLLRNKTDQPLQYRPDGFSLHVGERVYPQSVSDASGTIPPKTEAPAYFAVTGTPNGGRNDISLKNEFIVVIDAVASEQPKPEPPKPEPPPGQPQTAPQPPPDEQQKPDEPTGPPP